MEKLSIKTRDSSIPELRQCYHYVDIFMGDGNVASIMIGEILGDRPELKIHVWDELLEDPVIQLSGKLDSGPVQLLTLDEILTFNEWRKKIGFDIQPPQPDFVFRCYLGEDVVKGVEGSCSEN